MGVFVVHLIRGSVFGNNIIKFDRCRRTTENKSLKIKDPVNKYL